MFEDIIDIINKGLKKGIEKVKKKPDVACYTCVHARSGWSKQPCSNCWGSGTNYSKWVYDKNFWVE